ncbi:hypothetical protein RvY_10732 [Ramazzottius varieornatus]|uniref:VWFC domain-containing protein n=1 Tax=Ramazzottius varieornatus TaxID=947166 RepID=A0A1D1VFS2_RAMVA|nr:hypothetical protein RvY_10732 [Ramazzottius varieornatus]
MDNTVHFLSLSFVLALDFLTVCSQSTLVQTSETSGEALVPSTFARQCSDFQGRPIDAGSRFIPSKLRPCVECICVDGSPVLCGTPQCMGKVNCNHAKWNGTLCCRSECMEKSPVSRFAELTSRNTNAGNGDYQQLPYWSISRSDSQPVFGLDNYPGPAFRTPQRGATRDDAFSGPFFYEAPDRDNMTAAVPTRPANLPNPYYPILIGLISCAPVALCIICVNTIRKYFALRNQFPGSTVLSRRRRTHAQNGSQVVTSPSVFTEPPPAYTDLECPKFKYSEDLPKYEDIVQHEHSRDQKIFATTSSAQFALPGRSNLAFHIEDETEPSSSSSVIPLPSSITSQDVAATPSTSKAVVSSSPDGSVVSAHSSSS